MTKTVCDICGNDMPLEIYSRATKDYKFCISSYGKTWDICNKCRERLNKWINERKTESEANKSVNTIFDDMKSGVDSLIDDGLKIIEKRRKENAECTT